MRTRVEMPLAPPEGSPSRRRRLRPVVAWPYLRGELADETGRALGGELLLLGLATPVACGTLQIFSSFGYLAENLALPLR